MIEIGRTRNQVRKNYIRFERGVVQQMSKPRSGAKERTITTYELLERGAQAALDIQREDGSFPPGRNYSYDENSTPVRTTSQWLRTLTKVYEITGEIRFKQAANDAVNILLDSKYRPGGATYHCREVKGKDSCNGLVGQAAVIRSLTFAAESLDRTDALQRAEEVFKLHPFDYDLGLWESVEIDGELLSFDRTLNHQLLFADAASRLSSKSSVARERVQTFLDRLQANIEIRSNGLIRHYIHPPIRKIIKKCIENSRHLELLRNEVAHHYYTHSQERRKKERGYHTVNLEGLVKIHKTFSSHSFWHSETFQDALRFVYRHENELINKIDTKDGDALPGVSIAKIYQEFEDAPLPKLAELVAQEISENPTTERIPFKSLNIDEETAAAMIWELVELPDLELSNK